VPRKNSHALRSGAARLDARGEVVLRSLLPLLPRSLIALPGLAGLVGASGSVHFRTSVTHEPGGAWTVSELETKATDLRLAAGLVAHRWSDRDAAPAATAVHATGRL
jgi:hypothetical protein